jgi:hypothetical protein
MLIQRETYAQQALDLAEKLNFKKGILYGEVFLALSLGIYRQLFTGIRPWF